MDILYILGAGSLHNNEELRYSLRALEKNVCHAKLVEATRSLSGAEGRVVVVGENPGFLSEKVEFHYLPEAKGNKEYCIAKKVEWACQNVMQGDFLFMNDDFFLHKKIVPQHYPNYQKGCLSHTAPDSNYNKSLQHTFQYLKRLGHTTFHFDVHTPIIYNSDKFLALSQHWKHSKTLDFGMVVKSVYGNIYQIPHLPYKDVKLSRLKTLEDYQRIDATSCISCSDAGWRNGVADYLKHKFPNPSIYEKS
ncbi:hypothetical protein [Aequorivita echinoideorum]|uniref:Uncharacterized protein n=1 Tax=Aequorivita echinoideorum TaxID=1549647 RepID=A0ABS5S371_9FLAO|nr:hypothetical protein [Aequorivita echinoideorum]MBT0607648.1 hypothetical protein [Aequorivita echinoideorum]